MSTLLQDLRFAMRTFAQTPAFSLVALAVLAVGIGGNTAMFTIVNAMLFQPVAGHTPDIVQVYSHDRTTPDSYRSFSYPTYVDIRDGNDVFDGVLAHGFAMAGLPAGDTMRRSFVELVSSNYFQTLRVPLAAGRPFSADEERPAANLPVVIVRYERWEASGFDPAFIGSRLRINATDFTIVGVAPRSFGGTMALVSPELWLPLGMFDSIVNDVFRRKATGLADRASETLIVVGRLKPGITPAAATARLDPLSRQLEASYPAENKNFVLSTGPLARLSTSDSPESDAGIAIAGAALIGISACVLLIASLNVANMLLARGTSRRKEIAIRLALGGSRRRIIRQLVTESLLLALGGGAAGLLLSFWAVDFLVATLAEVMPLALTFDASPDLNVLLVTTAFAVFATLLSGIGPALKLSKRDLVNDLKEIVSDGGVLGRRLSGRNLMVVAQLALSLTLLACGALFARSAWKAASSTPGFSYDRGILVSVDPSLANHDEARGRIIYRDSVERVRAIPGVAAAGFASTVPFGDMHEGMPVERLAPAPADSEPSGNPTVRIMGADQSRNPTFRIIGADYFRALGLPILRGREFTVTEELSPSAPRVAIIDERLARTLFAIEDPVGQMVRFVRRPGDDAIDAEPMQIVGIVPAVREEVVNREPLPHIYVPWGRNYRAGMHLHVRSTSSDPAAIANLMGTIRGELRSVDATLPILHLSTLQRFHDRSLVLWAVQAGGRMLTAFGLLAMTLAVIGVYGVKAYVVSQRTREIGIRMALGANPSDVRALVLKEAVILTAIGVGAGLPIAALIGRALASLLFGISGLDPIVFVGAPLVLGLASMLASYIPARRAMRIEPTTALRAQ
jgi:predicted permease